MIDATGFISVRSLPLGRFLAEGAVDKSVMINHTQTIHQSDGTVSGIHGTSQLKRHSEVVGEGEQAGKGGSGDASAGM